MEQWQQWQEAELRVTCSKTTCKGVATHLREEILLLVEMAGGNNPWHSDEEHIRRQFAPAQGLCSFAQPTPVETQKILHDVLANRVVKALQSTLAGEERIRRG